jgi:acyl-CoA dehydrogenase
MDFTLSDNQQMYVDTVSRFVKNEIIPHVLELDRSPGML